MQIGVTNPAVQDVDGNVLRAKIASFETKWAKRRSCAMRGVTFNRDHNRSSLTQPMATIKHFVSTALLNVQVCETLAQQCKGKPDGPQRRGYRSGASAITEPPQHARSAKRQC